MRDAKSAPHIIPVRKWLLPGHDLETAPRPLSGLCAITSRVVGAHAISEFHDFHNGGKMCTTCSLRTTPSHTTSLTSPAPHVDTAPQNDLGI